MLCFAVPDFLKRENQMETAIESLVAERDRINSQVTRLEADRNRIDAAITCLQGEAVGPNNQYRQAGPTIVKQRRGRRAYTAAQKRAQGERMKAYWAKRRKAAKKAA